jgi:hypothetical protein
MEPLFERQRKNQGYRYEKNEKEEEIILLKVTHHTTRSGDIMNSGITFYDGNLCLVDSATTHTILKENKYLEYLTLAKANVTTISGPADMI